MSISFIWAPVMLRPDGSTTCPETVAVSSCAKAEFAAREASSKKKQDLCTSPEDGRIISLYSSTSVCGPIAAFCPKEMHSAAIIIENAEMSGITGGCGVQTENGV